MNRFSGLLIVVSGVVWGLMGVFVRLFTQNGFTTVQLAAMRLSVATLLMVLLILCVRPSLLKVSLKDLPLLSVLGILSIGIMGVLYFTTIRLSTLSTAAVLLYLSPGAVMLMSALFFKEKITPKKFLALTLAVGGCALVSGVLGGQSVGALALLTGIGSAVTYGSYSIIGPVALKKHHPFTVTAYAFGAAAIFLLCLCRPVEMVKTIAAQPSGWLFALQVLGLGLCTAFTPFLLYTLGLRYTPPSKAAVLACSEPVAATLYGILFFGEMPQVPAYVGMALVLCAIVLLSDIGKQKKDSR